MSLLTLVMPWYCLCARAPKITNFVVETLCEKDESLSPSAGGCPGLGIGSPCQLAELLGCSNTGFQGGGKYVCVGRAGFK